MRLFSTSDRPIHKGPYPLERLKPLTGEPDYADVPADPDLRFRMPEKPESLANAMAEFQAMMDAISDGLINKQMSEIPDDEVERAQHLKSFGYFSDASMMGMAAIPPSAWLETPRRNADIDRLAEALRTRQTKTLAAGIDMIMADLRDSMNAPVRTYRDHTHAIVILVEYPREPGADEMGADWIQGIQPQRACLRATEIAVVLANYVRLLGHDACAHTSTTSHVNLGHLAVASGLATVEEGRLHNPWLADAFGLAVVTTTLPFAVDQPMAPLAEQSMMRTHGPSWALGLETSKNAFNQQAFAHRRYVDGAHPFETLKRVDKPTTYMDEEAIPRIPKRTDMFARAQFGDMGKTVQKNATNGHYARKAAPSMAQRRLLGAMVLLQDGEPAAKVRDVADPERMAQNIRAASYYLGIDAVGTSRCPEWAWYSHNALGEAIEPPHDQAISMIVDQGFETMEGASGDDWISVAQSMRAYLRFAILGGVIAQQIRNFGYLAKAHTVMDGDVLQPPLLLLSGMGEVSRIGEVILNPFLGPRLKSGVVTTNMPMSHDKPIDFGLQRFCESCNKCARECPSGAITAGPKLMFNGYEIWKSDSQKCATYRITTPGGAMCGRCMKTCPWNLEGLFAEKPFRWAAMNLPSLAPHLAKLDDRLGKGGLNPVKKWWWDLEITEEGGYRPTETPVNARDLQPELNLRYEDQTLAVYPAPLAPHPWPFPDPMDREKGIEAYQNLVTAEVHQARKAAGEVAAVRHEYTSGQDSPVIRLDIEEATELTSDIALYRLSAVDGQPLPPWEAGAHVDIVIAPEFLRQYSLMGDPADRSHYLIGVLREDAGTGGSKLMHRIFNKGRKVFVSHPINHFPLHEEADMSYLMGGGIGVTPMIAMAHRLYALGRPFALHYSVSTRENAAFAAMLDKMPWREHIHLHVSAEGRRADLASLLSKGTDSAHVYCCGPDAYMQSVMEAVEAGGFPEDNRHLEYFSVPDAPDYIDRPFQISIVDQGKIVQVAADESAADALNREGFPVHVKCSDGLCGVCQCDVLKGHVEHRDFVLSKRQQETRMILCQSRAQEEDGLIEIRL